MESGSARVEQLRQQVEREPHRGDIRYLLGAEWAAAGHYDLAVEEMGRALELDPSLSTARLQLGLLHLTCARPAEAIATWRGLEALGDRDPLRMFARGLEALIRDDFQACTAWLEMGIRANHTNAALNRDMALVIDRIRPGVPLAAEPAAAAETPAVHRDFSLYGTKKN